MFLCRVSSRAIRLPRAPALQAFRSFTTTPQILYSDLDDSSEKPRSGSHNYNPGTISVGTLPLLSWSAPESQFDLRSKGAAHPKDIITKCRSYPGLRERHKKDLAQLPLETWKSVARSALQTKNETITHMLVNDVLRHGKQLTIKAASVLHILISAPEKIMLPSPMLLRITIFFRKYEELCTDAIQTQLIIHYAATLTRHSPVGDSTNHARQLRTFIMPYWREQIRNLPPPPKPSSANYSLPPLAQASLVLANSCLRWDLQHSAKEILAILAGAKVVPVQVRRQAHDADRDVDLYLVMVTTALHWHARLLAVYIMRDILSRPIPPSSLDGVIAACMEIVRALLEEPTDISLRSCGYLIRRVHPFGPMPGKYIIDFYRHAVKRRLSEAAKFLYAWSRQPEVMQVCHYPPPPPQAAVFLLRRLDERGSQTYLHRTLAQEMADDNGKLPRQQRAEIIAIAADKGYAVAARRMWETHADGDDKKVVVANARLMLKMVSLFYDLTDRAKHVLDYRDKDPVQRNRPLVDGDVMRQRADDLEAFTNRVIAEFVEAHSPLSEAHHFVLTTLARAYMVVGRFSEGFGALRLLMERNEALDMADMNVAFSGLAEQHPSMAVGLVERMRQRGLEPDEKMLGTILHAARLHKEWYTSLIMVNELQALSQKPDKALSAATVTTVLLTFADPVPGLDSPLPLVVRQARERQSENLRICWDFLCNARMLPKDIIAPQTGKQLVLSALRARDPTLAYDFWRRIVVAASRWDDREHRFLRGLIRDMVESNMEVGELDRKAGKAMLAGLQTSSPP
ncbi:hypothetical protein HDZ31DRAFT_40513 [Schizophyllum fasciatum]